MHETRPETARREVTRPSFRVVQFRRAVEVFLPIETPRGPSGPGAFVVNALRSLDGFGCRRGSALSRNGRSGVSAIHQSQQHRDAVVELKARGEVQYCWSCDRELRASAKRGDPQLITLGHYHDVEVGLVSNPYDPSAYGPQCETCNSAGGARRTNAKRRGDNGREVRASPDWE